MNSEELLKEIELLAANVDLPLRRVRDAIDLNGQYEVTIGVKSGRALFEAKGKDGTANRARAAAFATLSHIIRTSWTPVI